MNPMSTPLPSFSLPTLPSLRETRVFGRKICYYDAGHGPPLVLVHGVGGDADQWDFCLEALVLSGLRAPTLIVWGAEDAMTPLAMAHAYRRGHGFSSPRVGSSFSLRESSVA